MRLSLPLNRRQIQTKGSVSTRNRCKWTFPRRENWSSFGTVSVATSPPSCFHLWAITNHRAGAGSDLVVPLHVQVIVVLFHHWGSRHCPLLRNTFIHVAIYSVTHNASVLSVYQGPAIWDPRSSDRHTRSIRFNEKGDGTRNCPWGGGWVFTSAQRSNCPFSRSPMPRKVPSAGSAGQRRATPPAPSVI